MKQLSESHLGSLIAIVAIFNINVLAQWTPNGIHIYNSNTGNVGIGTGTSFTPTKKLEIQGVAPSIYLNGSTSNFLEFNTTGVAAPAFTTRSSGTKLVLYPNISGSSVDYAIGIESNTLWQSIPSNICFYKWYAGTTELMRLDGSGNMAIGVNVSTNGKLSISKSYDNNLSPRANHLYLTDPTNTNLKGYIGLNRNSGAGADKEYLSIEAVEENVHWMNLALAAEGGYVGIGTTAPTQKLEIVGNGKISGTLFGNSFNQDMVATGDGQWTFGGYQNGLAYWMQATYWDDLSANRGFRVANRGVGGPAGEAVFSTNKTSTLIPFGNVGIGTPSPSAKLQVNTGTASPAIIINNGSSTNSFLFNANGNLEIRVQNSATNPAAIAVIDPATSVINFRVKSNGVVHAREVEVLSGTFPDYVFGKDYQLISIDNLENYINANGHLPGFENAAYYEKNGMKVSELITKQQEKIEELSLYIIELQKRMKKLEENNK